MPAPSAPWPEQSNNQALWRALLAPPPGAPVSAEQFAFVATLTSPCTAASLLPGASGADRPDVRTSCLANLYVLQSQYRALADLAAAGVEAVALKGFAHAHLHYDQPEQRAIGDLDILVARADVGRLIAALRPQGFRFGAPVRPRWGFIADSSYIPFYSPDRSCNIDIHVQPDAEPLHWGLDQARLRAHARRIGPPGREFLAPSATHLLALLVSNCAKDRFFPGTLRKLIDAAALLRIEGQAVDWPELAAIMRAACLEKALASMLRLLIDLGLPASQLGLGAPMAANGEGATYGRLLRQWRELSLSADQIAGLRREPVLFYRWPALWRRYRRRVIGLLFPSSGIPKEGRQPD